MILMGELIKDLPVMKALDADGDGELSTSEIENASKALMRLDKNGDGKLSTEELRPDPSERKSLRPEGGRPGEGGPQMSGEFFARMFDTRDANKDGKLSGDEIPERMQGMLARVDKDGDGAISKEEMTKATEMMAGRGKGEPGAGRRGDGEEGPVKPKRPN
jgi:Ca2+-binding EF-hand superfamily protein